MAELQADDKKRADEIRAEDKKGADKIHADIQAAKIQAEAQEKKRADEIKIQMAKIEADKELTLKEMELKAKIKLVPVLQLLHLFIIGMPSPQSYHPLSTRRTN